MARPNTNAKKAALANMLKKERSSSGSPGFYLNPPGRKPTPAHKFTPTPGNQFTPTPAHKFTPTPGNQFTPTPGNQKTTYQKDFQNRRK